MRLWAEVSKLLYSLGEISGRTIFVDGTKIESAANKYTFVWKKAVTKNQVKLFEKILAFVEECEALYGLRIVHHGKVSVHTLKGCGKSCTGSVMKKELSLSMEAGREKHASRNPSKHWKPIWIN